jgi:hypothetical protein
MSEPVARKGNNQKDPGHRTRCETGRCHGGGIYLSRLYLRAQVAYKKHSANKNKQGQSQCGQGRLMVIHHGAHLSSPEAFLNNHLRSIFILRKKVFLLL